MKDTTRAIGQLMAPGARAVRTLSAARTLTMLGWHRLGGSADGLTTTFDDFRRHLDVLEEWGAVVLPLEDAHRRLAAGDLPERTVVLTFDDGYASIVEQAWPELCRRGMPATLYAVSGFASADQRFPWDRAHWCDTELTRLVSDAELRDVSDAGLDIGSHTVTHRWLPGLSADEVDHEVTSSRSALEDLLQRPVRSFSYPMGGWNAQIRTAVQRAGYTTAVTTERGRNRRSQDPLTYRRPFAFHRPKDVRRQLDGAYTWMRPIERSRRGRVPRW